MANDILETGLKGIKLSRMWKQLCSSFHGGIATMEMERYFLVHYAESLISVFQDFFVSIDKILILAGRLGTGHWALGYHSMGFRHFPDIS